MFKKNKFKLLKILVPVVIAVTLAILPVIGVLAATTADIAVTAQGKFVSFSSNVSTYDFGLVAESSTTNMTGTWIGFTNTSSVSTNISVKMLATAWEAAAAGWTHSDTVVGANTAAMKANSTGDLTWTTSVFVKFTAPFNEVKTGLAASTPFATGLSLLAPTSFTNGNSNNNTVRFSIYAAN